MIQNTFFRLLCALSLFFCVTGSALAPTNYTPLPPPYSYLENLYFDARSDFIILAEGVEKNRIMQRGVTRGFRLISIPESEFTFCYPDLAWESPLLLEGTTLLFMDDPVNYLFHFFHLLEHLVGAWAFYGCDFAQDVQHIILAGTGLDQNRTWQGPNQINAHLLRALFPHAQVKTWHEFCMEGEKRLICFERILTSDRAITYTLPECRAINKHLGAALAYINPITLHSFAKALHSYVQTPVHSSSYLRVTYITRPPPRCLNAEIEAALIKKISSLDGVRLIVEDLAQISFHKQIQLISNTDVLIGVHGNGLSHLLFLPDHASIIELFPPDNHHLDYHLFADARNISYYGLLYKSSHFLSRQQAYERGAYGRPGEGIDVLDIDLILSLLKQKNPAHPTSKFKKNR